MIPLESPSQPPQRGPARAQIADGTAAAGDTVSPDARSRGDAFKAALSEEPLLEDGVALAGRSPDADVIQLSPRPGKTAMAEMPTTLQPGSDEADADLRGLPSETPPPEQSDVVPSPRVSPDNLSAVATEAAEVGAPAAAPPSQNPGQSTLSQSETQVPPAPEPPLSPASHLPAAPEPPRPAHASGKGGKATPLLGSTAPAVVGADQQEISNSTVVKLPDGAPQQATPAPVSPTTTLPEPPVKSGAAATLARADTAESLKEVLLQPETRLAHVEARGGPLSVTAAAAAPITAEPRAVVNQVVAALTKGENGSVDLRLDPPELGRVTVSLLAKDDGITAMVSAERGDTQDLLRRHADLLSRALKEAGYSEVALDFAASGQRDGQDRHLKGDGARSSSTDAADMAAPPGEPRARVAMAGLDIRI